MIRRREFITLIGGAAAWPLSARAQQSAMPVIGYVNSGTAGANVKNVAAFRAGLTEAGFVEGQNVAIEFRWAENQFDRLPALVTGLINRPAASPFPTGTVYGGADVQARRRAGSPQ